MSYYASGEGYMTFKSMTEDEKLSLINFITERFELRARPKALVSAITYADENMANICNGSRYADDNKLFLSFDLLHEYGSYHNDGIIEELEFFAPYLSEGNFEFIGEDGAHWRFDFRNGEWHDESGEVFFRTDEPMTIKPSDNEIVIKKGGLQISLTESEFLALEEAVDRNIFYRRDVMRFLKTLVESNELHSNVLKDEAACAEFIDLYAHNRSEHDPGCGNFVWDYTQSLEDAYEHCTKLCKYKIWRN